MSKIWEKVFAFGVEGGGNAELYVEAIKCLETKGVQR